MKLLCALAWRIVAAAIVVVCAPTPTIAAQPYDPAPERVPAPPLDVEAAAAVLVDNGSITTIQPVRLPWQEDLPVYAVDSEIVAIVTPTTLQWSSPLADAVSFGPVWEGTIVEIHYLNRSRAYVFNCVSGAYSWVDLAHIELTSVGNARATCEEQLRSAEAAGLITGPAGDPAAEYGPAAP